MIASSITFRPATVCLTLGLSGGMNIVTLGTIPRKAELREIPWSFSIKLRSETQFSGRLGVDPLNMPRTRYQVSEGKRSQ